MPQPTSADPERSAPVDPARQLPLPPLAPDPDPDPTPPRFARARAVPRRQAGWAWWLLAGALLLVLCAQAVLADRARLAGDPRWRAGLERVCGVLGCTLPTWHAPQEFRLTARDVRPHPSVADALLVTASFRNDARFAQDWPVLELRMSDLDGRAIAQRRFSAREYLSAPAPGQPLAPRQSANVTLEIVDPGRDAVAFEFGFL